MSVETLERPQSIPMTRVAHTKLDQPEPNFGPEDMHAIRAIAFIMNGIFLFALALYAALAVAAGFGF